MTKHLLIVALIALAGCASKKSASDSPEAARKSTTAKDPAPPSAASVDQEFKLAIQDEVTVGKGIASRLLGSFGYFNKKPDLEKYLNLVGQTLVVQSGRPELTYHFAILDTDEINAFATPGGYIFVTRGLLSEIRSEDELACVLGHEIAHVNLKHMYKDIAVKRQVTTGEILARALSRGGADIGGAVNELVSKGLKMLVEDGLGKEKEFEADSFGITYAAFAGYDPSSLSRLVDRLEKDQGHIKVAKTHPQGQERLQALQKDVATNQLPARSNKNQAVIDKRFSLAVAALPKSKKE